MLEHGLRVLLVASLLLVGGCAVVDDLGARRKQPAPATHLDPRDSAMVANHLRTLESIARGTPSEQAEIAEEVRRQATTDPTLFNRLRLALVLGLPGHAASDPVAARDQLGTLLATPEMMLPAEIAIAHVMLHEVNARIALEGERDRTAEDAGRDGTARIETLTRRLQAQSAENARLRQALAEAVAKLEAVADLERNIAERRNGTERPP